MAASEAAPEMEKIDWWSGRAKQTQSRPKHSLFGTNMEAVDRSELEKMEGRYIPEGYVRPQKNRYPLPDHMQSALTGNIPSCRIYMYLISWTIFHLTCNIVNIIKSKDTFCLLSPQRKMFWKIVSEKFSSIKIQSQKLIVA